MTAMSHYASRLRQPPRTMTDDEVTKVLRTSGQHVDGFRDHVIMSLGFASALREHEIVALNIGQVFDAAGRARQHVFLTVFKGCRRSGAPPVQEVVLPDLVRRKLEKLYRLKKALGHDMSPDAPVFVSRKGSRLSTRQVRRMFATWQARAGLERHSNFHRVRHTSCSALYRRTRDVRAVQRLSRHASLEMVQIYTHINDEDFVRAVQDQPC